jgi:Mg-chelatase subunit ChlD
MGIKRRKKSITNPTRRVAYYYIDDVCVSEVVPNTTCACESKKTVSKYNRMALMVDVSGSMAQNGKLDSVKTALKQFISKIPGETELMV